MEFFDRYFHTSDRNETRIWSSLSAYEPSYKIWYKSVHNLFSYHGHSHR